MNKVRAYALGYKASYLDMWEEMTLVEILKGVDPKVRAPFLEGWNRGMFDKHISQSMRGGYGKDT